jgi:hypothetical protein
VAQAADGGSLLLGFDNHATAGTLLQNDAGAQATVGALEVLDTGDGSTYGYTWGTLSRSANGLGVLGVSGTPETVNTLVVREAGVYGYAAHAVGIFGQSDNAAGVVGQSDANAGVQGMSQSNAGVYGTSQSDAGVFGFSDTGSGVAGSSQSSVGVFGFSQSGTGGKFTGGQAPLLLGLAGAPGAPASGTHSAGELYLDSAATLWICTGPGTHGTWVRLTSVASGALGGAPTFLSAPIRIFDSRSGQPAPLPASKHPMAGGSTTTIQVTGTSVGGLSVPTGAQAVIGNLTVTNTQGGGALILYPHGVSRPVTSNINYSGGATVANFAMVGLSLSGAMDLFVVGAGTDALFDVAGYLA